MTHSIAKTTRSLALITAAALGMTGVAQASGQYNGYIQTISVSSTKGTTQMHQIFKPNTRSPNVTRVCLVNRGDRTKAFTHAIAGVNALTAAPGGRSCANFDSSIRLGLGMLDGGEPATPSRTMVMSLDAFAGGTVRFLWE